MTLNYALFSIVGMFLATYPVRALPIIWFNKKKLSPFVKIWLGYIPVAIYASLLMQTLLDEKANSVSTKAFYPFLLGTLSCAITTHYSKSSAIGMLTGIGVFAASVFVFC